MHIADRSTESFHTTETLLIPKTKTFAVSLTLKLDLSLYVTLLHPASALTETGIKKNLSSKLHLAKLQYAINV